MSAIYTVEVDAYGRSNSEVEADARKVAQKFFGTSHVQATLLSWNVNTDKATFRLDTLPDTLLG